MKKQRYMTELKRIISWEDSGFTLVELLLVVALMAIAVGVTSDILVSLVRSYNKSQVINEVEQNANFVGQKLAKELRNAASIDNLVAVGDTSPSVTFTTRAGDEIQYQVNSGIIQRDFAGSGWESLTVNNASPPFGVNAQCINTGACFTLLANNPQVVQISIIFTQGGTGGNVAFEGEVKIEDTIVIRDTY